jgi:hypothetical protein
MARMLIHRGGGPIKLGVSSDANGSSYETGGWSVGGSEDDDRPTRNPSECDRELPSSATLVTGGRTVLLDVTTAVVSNSSRVIIRSTETSIGCAIDDTVDDAVGGGVARWLVIIGNGNATGDVVMEVDDALGDEEPPSTVATGPNVLSV